MALAGAGYGVHAFTAERGSCSDAVVAAETAGLVASNGLYYLPQLRADRDASLYDSAYGLLTLQALGRHPKVSVSSSDLAQLREADAGSSPVWSRWYIFAVQSATGQKLLTAKDAAAVARLLSPAGYFDDQSAGAPAPGTAQQVATSSAALDILATVRGETYTRSLSSTKRWIAGVLDQFSGNPYVGALADTAMRHLGLETPPQVVESAESWYRQLRTSGANVDYNSASHGLFGYTRTLTTNGRTPERDPGFFAQFFRTAADQADLQQGYYAAASWSTLSGDTNVIAPLERRIEANLMPNGLIREQAVRVGTIDATYEMVRILEAHGEQACGRVAPKALVAAKKDNWSQWDPITKGMWLVATEIAGGNVDDATRRAVYAALVQAVPAGVTPDTARRWAVIVELLKVIGGRLPQPSVSPWPVDNRLGVMAAAVMVNTAVQADQPLPALQWIKQQDLATALARPDLTPTLEEYLDALRAFAALGGDLSPALLEDARRRVDEVRGCPGLPHLIRSVPRDAVCDLRATMSAVSAVSVIPTLDVLK